MFDSVLVTVRLGIKLCKMARKLAFQFPNKFQHHLLVQSPSQLRPSGERRHQHLPLHTSKLLRNVDLLRFLDDLVENVRWRS